MQTTGEANEPAQDDAPDTLPKWYHGSGDLGNLRRLPFLFMEDVMTDFSDCRKGFYHLSKSWYASSVYHEYDEFADEIMIGMYADDGSTAGEFGIRWYEIDPQHGHVPRLEAYGVAWHVSAQLYDLLEVMADQNNEKITPDELRELLLSFGYNDLTKYEEPNRGNVTE